VLNDNIPADKLSLQQLKVLCMHKKRDDDKVAISKLKRPGLLALWLTWQSRPDIEFGSTGTEVPVPVPVPVPQGVSQTNVDHNPVTNDHGDVTMNVEVNVDVSVL